MVAEVQDRAVNRLARAHGEVGDVGLEDVRGRVALDRRKPLVPGGVVGVAVDVNRLLHTRLEHIVGIERTVDSDPGRGVPAAPGALRLEWLGNRRDGPVADYAGPVPWHD